MHFRVSDIDSGLNKYVKIRNFEVLELSNKANKSAPETVHV